jgi:uncharacterized NAD(P)/FAD-binding protein YdhS
MRRFLIVGGGASGVITAIAIARSNPHAHITIAEPRSLLGEGLAYSTRDSVHRLNVPTEKMSAIAELPEDFVEWTGVEGYTFQSRAIYSTYLRERLDLYATDRYTHKVATVTKLTPGAEIRAEFSDEQAETFDVVALAMGHGSAKLPDFLNNVPPSGRIITDVWDGKKLPDAQTLICFGTGLTFIDIALTHLAHLEKSPHNKVIGLSGSGNLPEKHKRTRITPFSPTLEEVDSLTKLREYISNAGENWREAVDGLRPITAAMWRAFTAAEKEEFLATDGSAWSRRRHRIAPNVAEKVAEMIDSGRLEVRSVQVSSVHATDSDVTVVLQSGESLHADLLAICIGRTSQADDQLSRYLIENQITNAGPLGLGLSVDVVTGQLKDAAGHDYLNIFAIGPLRSGEAFETTAIPEIRKQAAEIAANLL